MKHPTISKYIIKKHIPDCSVVLEAGAHRGRDTLKLHALWPHATIHAFEPVPLLYTLLRTATADISAIRCYNYALSTITGVAPCFISTGKRDTVSSLLEPNQPHIYYPDVQFTVQQVPTITLDDWAHRYAISRIDFMWLDMQGFELFMLRASTQSIATVKALYMEVNTIERYLNLPLYNEIQAWLASQGFTIVAEALGMQGWGNILALRKAS